MTVPSRKTVLAILLVDKDNTDGHLSWMLPVHVLHAEEGELKSLGFEVTEAFTDVADTSAFDTPGLDIIKFFLNKKPHFDAVTVHFTPNDAPGTTAFLTDLIDTIAKSSWPISKNIVFATKPAELKAGLLKMFPEHAVLDTPDFGEKYNARMMEKFEKKFGKMRQAQQNEQ